MTTQLYPEVKDASTLGAVFSQPINLPIGVEGWMDDDGAATINVPEVITRPSDAEVAFGVDSSLTNLVKFLLKRGMPSVTAVASVSGDTPPTLTQRKVSWALLEANPTIRIRLTDSVVQADLVALADSCEWADGIQNKQVAFVGLASGSSKATLNTAAGAIASKRGVIVGPGIYDENGILLSGSYAAAWVAVERSKNADLSDDMDTMILPGSTGIEADANAMPIFRIKAGAGTPVNDFEDILQAGGSPLERDWNSGAAKITHLRMAYVTDATFDALQTRLIVDFVFLAVRDYARANNYLRKGNTQKNRDDLAAGIEQLLTDNVAIVTPVLQSDASFGYGVTVTPSDDLRSATIYYEGEIVVGFSTLLIDGNLSIPV